MAKKVNVDYRKICREYYGYTSEQMKGMDVHHLDGDRDNNHPTNLLLVTPDEHAKIHENDFVKWSRKGSLLGNQAFIKRLTEKSLIRLLPMNLGTYVKSEIEKFNNQVPNEMQSVEIGAEAA